MYLKTVGVNNLIADGALHEHEVKLFFLVLHRVLFPRLSTDETHRCVRQDGLRKITKGLKIRPIYQIRNLFDTIPLSHSRD